MLGPDKNLHLALNASLSHLFIFKSLTRAVEKYPEDRGSYQNKPQLHKVLRIAEKSPPFHTLVDTGKNLPLGPIP